MVELIDNIFQFLVTLICGIRAMVLYGQTRKQPYFLLSGFYGCWALGGLYWTLYYCLFSYTPHVFYVSDITWICSYIFLFILQYELSNAQERTFRCWAMWLAPLIGIPLFAFYCTYGDIFLNIGLGVLVILVSWNSIRGFCYQRGKTEDAVKSRSFHKTVMLLWITEYGLWTTSCFWVGSTLSNPYFWFDFLLTIVLATLLPVSWKVIEQ
ncbi:histidine kinase [uncultured Ruthenibacterium sp.]|uniref:histidine kinase n=1 Tax=uncultured Ruthenibacterium sp. TaxID=1905347 RepID=UPI00349E71FA